MNTKTAKASKASKGSGGSGGSGVWRWQRISALALIPLTLWFVFAILAHIGDSHRAALAWVAQPGVAAALIAYLAAMFFHSQLGLREIIEDYVASPATKAGALLATKIVNLAAASAAIAAVLIIALQ